MGKRTVGRYAVLLLLLGVGLCPLTALAQTNHSGTCAGTFVALNNPHRLIGTCTVPAGQTLTLEAGVVFEGQGNTLFIDGTLNAASVTMTSIFLSYRDGSGGTVQGSSLNTRVFLAGSSTLTPAAPTFSNNTLVGLDVQGTARPTINTNVINAGSGIGVDVRHTARPVIGGNSITTNAAGLRYLETGGGSATGNTVRFPVQSSSGRRGIEVNQGASPLLESNTIEDDPTRNDIGIQLLVDTTSTVIVRNNAICVTGGDQSLIFGLGVFVMPMNAVVTGNTFPCGAGAGFTLAAGTVNDPSRLTALNGVSVFSMQGTVTIASGASLTLASGVTLQGQGLTLQIQGALHASGVAFTNVFLNYADGSSGTVQNSTFGGNNRPVFLTGSSILTPATPTFTNNTINSTATGIDVQGTARPTISGNTFTVSAVGIEVRHTSQPTISGNTITTNGSGIRYMESSRGTATGNTLRFPVQGSSGRIGFQVNQAASPVIENNTIEDDPTRTDHSMQINVDSTSTVVVRTNSLCATGSDIPLALSLSVFVSPMQATITGNTFPCGQGAGVQLSSGTVSSNTQLKILNEVPTLVMQSTVTVASGITLTIPAGLVLQGQGNTIQVQGILNADGATFTNVLLSYLDGSGGTLQNSTLSGNSQPIRLSGSSVLTPAAPTLHHNTITSTSIGINVLGNTRPTISNNTITVSSVGIEVEDTAQPTITSNTIITNNFGLRYFDTAGGTATGNTLRFQLQGGSGRVGVQVNQSASPVIENNAIEDDPTRNDTGIQLAVDGTSTAIVRTNSICVTGGDSPLVTSLGVFVAPMQTTVTGNTLPCGQAAGLQVSFGTINGNALLKTLNGLNTITFQSTVTVANTATLTVAPGVILQGQSNSLQVQGLLHADGATFTNVFVNYLDGSGGTLQNSTLTGVSRPISISGTSILTPATPTIHHNTITATSIGIDIGGTTRPTISNNTITAPSVGIDIDGTAQPVISGNTITTNGTGIRYAGASGGMATENTLRFQLQGSSGREAISVLEMASPLLESNTIEDDPTRDDVGIHLGVDGLSTVIVRTNSICATAGDNPLRLSLTVFATPAQSTVTGNSFPCGQGAGILLLSGTVSSNSLLKALNGITTLVMQSTVTVANGITLGIETGLTLQGQSRTLQIQGLLNANGVTFASVVLSYQDGSGGTVQNSTFSGVSTPIQLSGNSTLTPAAPTINANTITATSTAIDVRGNTRPTIRNNVMTAPFTGVTVQDTAQPIIRDNTISTNGAGLSYSEFAAGTALGNTIQFQLQGSSGRRGIEVSQAASPTLDNNTITDDPTRDDIGVQLLVDTTSTVVVRTTSICATGGDRPFVLGPGSYGATVTGNLFPCGLGAGVQLASGTASSNVQLRPLNGVSTFNMQSTLTVASGVTLTIASGVTVQGQSRTLVVNGSLQADGVTFMDVFVDYRDGGAGNLRNSTLTGTGPISLSGTSTLTPATPIISNNTITTSGVAIDIRGTARPTVRDNVITTNSRGLRYADASGGTATSNTIRFQLQGSSSRVGIEVNNSASPGVENNTIEDDPTRNDTGIYLGVDALSTAAVRTNNICTTGGDTPLVFGLGVFRVPIQVSVSGNTFPCGLGTGAQIVSGTVNNNAQLQALNGFSTYTIQSTVTVAAGVTLTIPGGLTLQGQSFNRSLVVNGVLNATGATFVDVSLDYRDGSGGTVQNSTFMGSSPIAFSGSSPLTPAAPVITGNTITATSVGIDVSGTARPTLSNNAITTNAVGVRYTSTARGSMTGNSIAFQPEGSSGRRGVEVSQTAAPNIDGNSITDDPTRNDIGIQLLVDTSSTVMVKNNSICATGGDNPLVLGLGVFGSVMNAVVTGNTFPCGQGENIALASGTLTGNTMLRSLDGLSTFTLQSTVTVPSGVTLSIPAGITVQGLNRTLRVNGILNADGATFADVFLDFPSGSRGTIQHSTLSGPTFSAGLSLTSAVMTLRNNLIERFSTALDLAGTATVTAEDNVFRANTTVFRFQAATVRATIANNLFDANTNSLDFSTADILFSAFPAQFQTNAFTGTATQNIISTPGAWNVSGTLRSAPVPYGCASNITISNTATVTLEPGVVIQCPSFRGITVDGELVAIGTPTSPIIFTAANPKAGNRWNGLLIRNKQSALNVTTLQHCIVEFANTGITLDNASIPVRDCLITDNASDGLLLTNSAAPVVEDNAILQNMAHGIHSRTGARPIVHGNSIFGNGQNGIQNDDAVVINAEHNFWGDDTGPRDVPTDTRCNTLSNPVGAGEDVSDCVDFDPWIRVGPSLAGTITLVSGNGQQGQAGQILPQPLVVALRSPLGSPLQGINVIFSIVHGDATIREAMPVATDANGRAMATVQLGATPGEIVIAVTARDVDSPLAMFMGETSGPSLFVMRLAATALDAPDDLFGRAKPGQVTLMWTPTAGADSFEVLRAEHVGGPYTLVGSTASGIYLDRSVVSGRTYFYIVQAIDASSRSGDSNEVAVAVPTPQQRR